MAREAGRGRGVALVAAAVVALALLAAIVGKRWSARSADAPVPTTVPAAAGEAASRTAPAPAAPGAPPIARETLGGRPIRPPSAPPLRPIQPPGPVTSSPPLSKDAVRSSIQEILPHVRSCYDKLRGAGYGRQGGRIVVSFTLVAKDGQGHIREGEVSESDLPSPLLGSCVTSALLRAQFPLPPGDGEAHVTYPFLFKPDHREEKP